MLCLLLRTPLSALLFEQPSTLGHMWVRDGIPNQFARVWGYCIDDRVGAEFQAQHYASHRRDTSGA